MLITKPAYFTRALASFGLAAISLLPAPTLASATPDPQALSDTVRVLASDAFGGRAPGTAYEAKTIAYLVERFEAIGLTPGGENGDWTQKIVLNHTQLQQNPQIQFQQDAQSQRLAQGQDLEISTVLATDAINIDAAPIVFVGYGANAPERDWDDFGDIDLTGKVAVFLVNDPDFEALSTDAVAGRFGGKRMTYYGRWTYKFEEAARRGALAALVIHETAGAGYGWQVAASSPGENYAIALAKHAPQPLSLQGWLHLDAAKDLFRQAGRRFETEKRLAQSSDFKAFELQGVTFNTAISVNHEQIQSSNVLALLPGTSQKAEYLMVSSHWDAYGQGAPDVQGRTVRPGANDDALGTAGVIELARILAAGPPLARSIIFAVWTAEESGLLGSAAYAQNPLFPIEQTALNLTLDILQTAGPARDVILVGEGQSDLEGDLARAAARQGRVVTPENLPENGLFFRADHFSMARAGVPVLLLMGIAGGADLVTGGRAAGDQWIKDYIGNCYHQTCDVWDPNWDLRGAAQDIELFQMILQDLGNSTRWPQWQDGSEFKAIREQSQVTRTDSGSLP